MICPDCNGEKTSLAHINTGPDSSNHRWEMVACHTCSGSGEITDEHAQRISEGRKMAEERWKRGETICVAAKRMGLTSAQLSAIEHGRLPFNAEIKRGAGE